MSALVDDDVRRLLEESEPSRRLIVTPLLDPEKQIGPGSIDLRLGTEFLETARHSNRAIDPFDNGVLNVTRAAHLRSYVPLGDEFVLHPGQFVLGGTLEFVGLPTSVIAQVLSRSSWGRLGLLVATAVAIQPGFQGVLTLELVNAGGVPIVLRPGVRIAQMQLWRADREASESYVSNGKYKAPLGPESNRLAWEDSEKDKLRNISDQMHARSDRSSGSISSLATTGEV